MTTYMIGLAVLTLFYGFFWNNRTACELARLDDPSRDDRRRSKRSAS